MRTLIGLTKNELLKELQGAENYRVKQLWNWLYYYGKTDFDEMNNLSKDFRQKMKEKYTLARPKIITRQTSKDGTKKWLLEFDDGNRIEMVYIPETDRGTLCISSQVGCAMNCRFCNTGKQGFTRNLTAGEIVGQVLVARDELREWENLGKAIGQGRAISNIVLMGMGEPLLNCKNVENAVKIINDPDGIAFSNRRITLSTCGIVPQIKKLDLKVNLALSLHAPNDKIRKQIMPIAEKYTVDETMTACGEYAKRNSDRRVTFEYILIDGVNDSEQCAKDLIHLIRKHKIPAKFNLIPFNEWDGCDFKTSKNAVKFAKVLSDANYPTPIRKARGQDIDAACGQLKGKG
jgi:23S rRNA (adenine2503-C2)-methyltransferase